MTRLALVLLLLAPAASAADCELLESRDHARGRSILFKLCDGDHTMTHCGECDVPVLMAGAMPDELAFTLEKTTGCASVVNVRGLAAPVGQPFLVGALSLAGQTSVVIPQPRWRRFDATIATPAGCTDVEVLGTATYRFGGRLP